MKNSLKGAYLSGLVYPGAGQMLQKHYVRGAALMVVVTAALAASILSASRHAQAILTDIQSTGADYDVWTLLHEVSKVSAGRTDRTIELSTIVIVACWIVGIADAYVAGKKIDAE